MLVDRLNRNVYTFPLKTVRNSDVRSKLLNLFHFKNICELSTMYSQIALPLSWFKTTALSRIVARCLHLAAGCHKGSCSFCWDCEEGFVLRESTVEIHVWRKLLKCHLVLLERHLLSPALSCGLSFCVEERLGMGWCGIFGLETFI